MLIRVSPLGFCHGSALFQHFSDTVRHIMRQRNFDVNNYMEDVIGIDVSSKISDSFITLQDLLQSLGFELSAKEIVNPTRKMNCLGIMVDREKFTTSIPHEKLQEILKICIS